MQSNKVLLTLAATIATPALAEPGTCLRVGILDVQADRLLFKDSATTITHRNYNQKGHASAKWLLGDNIDHGQVVATAFVQQIRKIDPSIPICIYSANALEEKGSQIGTYSQNGASKKALAMNWEGAEQALSWFGEMNVKIIISTIGSTNGPHLAKFMKKIEEGNFVLVSSSGNGDPRIFPAAFTASISVGADAVDLPLRTKASYSKWVNFAADGVLKYGYFGSQGEKGSSIATPRVGAFGAYYANMYPTADTAEVRNAIKSVSIIKNYEVRNEKITVNFLDENMAAQRIRNMPRMSSKFIQAAQVEPSAEQQRPISIVTASINQLSN